MKVILDLEPPKTYKGVQVFKTHMNYYRRYVKIVEPMFSLINRFEWTEEAAISFEKLKKLLASAPMMRLPNGDVVFHVHIDVSGFAIGSILTQPGEHKMDYPIYFSRKQLNKAEHNYTTTEREGLVMIYS